MRVADWPSQSPATAIREPRQREIHQGAVPGAGEGLSLDFKSCAEKSPSPCFWAQVLLYMLTADGYLDQVPSQASLSWLLLGKNLE